MKNLILSILAILFSFQLFAQNDFSGVKIEAKKVTDNIYMLTGAGGNILVCTGEDGVFMVDDQFAPLSDKIKAAIAKLSDHPVKFLMNTHWHGDHTGGNENFGTSGSIIVAHENVRKRMSTEQMMKAFSRTVPASPEAAWPGITFSEDINFYFNDEDIIITHSHNAHTDGDAIVFFPKSNVIHTGDTYFNGRFPFIDLSSGGSINGIIESANRVLFMADEDTKIIPGHGALSNKEEFSAYRNVLMTARDKVQKAIKVGKTLEQMQAEKILDEYDAKWGQNFIKTDKIIDFIYTDLTREDE